MKKFLWCAVLIALLGTPALAFCRAQGIACQTDADCPSTVNCEATEPWGANKLCVFSKSCETDGDCPLFTHCEDVGGWYSIKKCVLDPPPPPTTIGEECADDATQNMVPVDGIDMDDKLPPAFRRCVVLGLTEEILEEWAEKIKAARGQGNTAFGAVRYEEIRKWGCFDMGGNITVQDAAADAFICSLFPLSVCNDCRHPYDGDRLKYMEAFKNQLSTLQSCLEEAVADMDEEESCGATGSGQGGGSGPGMGPFAWQGLGRPSAQKGLFVPPLKPHLPPGLVQGPLPGLPVPATDPANNPVKDPRAPPAPNPTQPENMREPFAPPPSGFEGGASDGGRAGGCGCDIRSAAGGFDPRALALFLMSLVPLVLWRLSYRVNRLSL